MFLQVGATNPFQKALFKMLYTSQIRQLCPPEALFPRGFDRFPAHVTASAVAHLATQPWQLTGVAAAVPHPPHAADAAAVPHPPPAAAAAALAATAVAVALPHSPHATVAAAVPRPLH